MPNGFCNSLPGNFPVIDPVVSRSVGFPAVLVNGVFHRAPGMYSLPPVYSDSVQNLANSDFLDKNKELESVSTDPFLVSLDYERFGPKISTDNEDYLDARLTRVHYEDLVQDDFKFLSDPNKVLLDISRCAKKDKEEPQELPAANLPDVYLIEEEQSEGNRLTPKTSIHRSKIKVSSVRGIPKKISKELNNNEVHISSNKNLKPSWGHLRGIQAPLRLGPEILCRMNQGNGFVGFCCELKANPFYQDCTGRVSVSKDEEGNCSLHCDNCSTRRRYVPEV
ncbi:hypothetical protein FO519_005868, partial [Halicephalobus sp. NKZ332]